MSPREAHKTPFFGYSEPGGCGASSVAICISIGVNLAILEWFWAVAARKLVFCAFATSQAQSIQLQVRLRSANSIYRAPHASAATYGKDH
jgi:hypothetical protein